MILTITIHRVTPAIAALVQALQEADDASTALQQEAAASAPGILPRCEITPPKDGTDNTAVMRVGDDKPAEEKPKRTRRTKEQIAADEAAAAEQAKVDPEAKTEIIAKPAETPGAETAMQRGEDLFGDTDKPAKAWSKEELRALLTACAEDPKRGPEKARQLMREHGKADRLSDIQPIFYGAVAAALGA